jgi:hypothetical protein
MSELDDSLLARLRCRQVLVGAKHLRGEESIPRLGPKHRDQTLSLIAHRRSEHSQIKLNLPRICALVSTNGKDNPCEEWGMVGETML